MQLALQQYQTGQLEQAQKTLRKVLTVVPDNHDANHLLGVIALQLGKYENAARFITRAIRANPNIALAHNNLGEAYRSQKLYDNAAECYRKAATLEPRFAGAHNNLAVVLLELDQPEVALASLENALSLEPNNAMLHTNRGNALKALGDKAAAKASFEKALTLDPRHFEAHNNLGSLLIETGDLEDAVAVFKKALAIDPEVARGHANLGLAHQALGETTEALASFAHALAIDETNVEALLGMGDIDHLEGRIDDAIASFKRAVGIDPTNSDAYSKLANSLLGRGDNDEALANHKKALALDPTNPMAHVHQADTFLALGQIDEAIDLYRHTIALDECNAEAHRMLSSARKHTEFDDDMQAMTELYARQELTDRQRMHLGFGLAKAHEDLKEFEKAFDYVHEGNRLKRATVSHRTEERRAYFDRIKQSFSSEYFSTLSPDGCQDETPIFIVGMPRSGTSLAEQILSSHSMVYGAGELNAVAQIADRLGREDANTPFPEIVQRLNPAQRQELGADYVRNARRHAASEARVSDKMPDNFVGVGLIHMILPKAKIIHNRRSAMDTCLSIYKNLFARGHPYAYDLTDLGEYYNLYLDLMNHWHEVLPVSMYELTYEHLVADQEAETRRLLEFCGLPWEDACLEFQSTERRVYTASAAQVRRPMYKDSVALWKRYGDRLEPLLKALERDQTK